MRISDWSSDVCSSDLGSSSIAPGLLRRPRGQFLAPDLGVVADVDREARVEEEGFDPCSVHEAIAEMAQFVGDARPLVARDARARSEEHTSELQSLMRISYAVFCLKKKNNKQKNK